MDLDFLTHLPAQRDLLARVLDCYGPDERVLGLMLYGWLAGWEQTIARPEHTSILAAVAALVAGYTRLRDHVARQLDLSFDLANETLMRRRLVDLGVPLALPA